ncbi:MAG: putative toxin-antitoxin system toxin component, PIN family [Bacteroidales bacterium]|nr:putative toxin-antitoxin system toxin component, PIN family [Bacteroidales bacterium]
MSLEHRNIVLDTNCLVQIISQRSPYRKVWDAFLRGYYTLNVTNEILDEYEEVLTRQTNTVVANLILDAIVNSRHTIFCNVYYNFNLIDKDPDDNKFVDCAIASDAEYIVSDDKHFDILKSIPFPHVEVKSLESFSRTF